jgi:hypothetical protein
MIALPRPTCQSILVDHRTQSLRPIRMALNPPKSATSVRGATHIQQRDLGQQSDPPAPPGRRLAAVASSF